MNFLSKVKYVFLTCLTTSYLNAQISSLDEVVNQTFCDQSAKKTMMPDGKSFAIQNNSRILQIDIATGKEIAVLFDENTVKGEKVKSVDDFEICQQGKQMLILTKEEKIGKLSKKGHYFVYDIQRKRAQKLMDTTALQRDPVFSPNGRNIIFAIENNLFLKKLDYDGIVIPITKEQKQTKLYHGVTDLMYEEEFDISNLMAWSSDNRFFAFVTLDCSNVQQYSIVNRTQFTTANKTIDLNPQIESFPYPRLGREIETYTLNVYDSYYKTIKKVDLPKDDTEYIPRITWTSDPETFAVFTLNKQQKIMRMYQINCKSQLFNLLYEEREEQWFDYKSLKHIHFLPDNKFTLLSERDGFRHLYLYNANGILNHQITNGNFDVTDVYGVDTLRNIIYYQAAKKNCLNREIYAYDLNKNKETIVQEENGWNTAVFSADFSFYEHQYSSLNKPTSYNWFNAKNKQIRTSDENAVLTEKIEKKYLKELFSIKNETGDSLFAWIMKPKNFDPNKKYPVVVKIHGAPETQIVKNKFELNWEAIFYDQGIIVVSLDVHGSEGRGKNWRKSEFGQLGLLGIKDINTMVKHLKSLSFVEKNNLSIIGENYGGFLALMAMTTGNPTWKTGIAIAPITDWQLYSSAYGDRLLNFKAKDISILNRSKNLNGNLLLIHNSTNKNIHIEHTLSLSESLINADKDFDVRIYHEQENKIPLRDLLKRMLKTIKQ
jgi:dipeptidyl-peptidase-4